MDEDSNGSGEPDADALVGCRWSDAVEACFSESSNCRYAQSLPTSRVSLSLGGRGLSLPFGEGLGSWELRAMAGRPTDRTGVNSSLRFQPFWIEMCRVVCCVCVVRWWTDIGSKHRRVWSSKREKAGAERQGRGGRRAWPVSGDRGRRRLARRFSCKGFAVLGQL